MTVCLHGLRNMNWIRIIVYDKSFWYLLLLKVWTAAILIFANVSQGFRHSPRHARRSIHARVTEEKPNLVEIPESEPESSSSLRKRKVKKRVLPEFYQSVQVTPTRKPVGTPFNCNHDKYWLYVLLAPLHRNISLPLTPVMIQKLAQGHPCLGCNPCS